MALLEDDAAQLREYTLAKQQVTACVRALKHLLEARSARADTPGTPGAPDALGTTGTSADPSMSGNIEEAQALVVKLAEDRFNLVVVGQFKRGKSSLMNAVIGRDLLPTGLLPLTSAITTLCYGPEEQVFLRRKGWSIEQKIPLSDLPEYITERGNPGNEKALVEARVQLPVRFLRRGLYFIDTPGVGSSRQENTATTYAFLPEADAVIFVTSVNAPLSETEQSFLRDIREHTRKLFVVVNKTDLLNELERHEVLGYISAGINSTVGSEDVRIFPVSARQALLTKLSADPGALQQSGLPNMEDALDRFLAREQGRAFLLSVLDRALGMLAQSGMEGERSARVDEAMPGASMPEGITAGRLRERMESLRATLLLSSDLAPLAAANGSAAASARDTETIDRAVSASVSLHERGRRKLRGETCPICLAQGQAVFDFYAHWQYALSTSEPAQRAFMASHGFCPVHTWQFEQMASPLGVSEGYAPLIEDILAELQRLVRQTPVEMADRIAWLLPTIELCAACRVLRETEIEQIKRFLAIATTPAGKATYSRSESLCLPHLQAALSALAAPSSSVGSSDEDTGRFLLQEQVRNLEEIAEDMRAYTLKRDALRRQLLNSREETAWKRALVQLVGERTARITSVKKDGNSELINGGATGGSA